MWEEEDMTSQKSHIITGRNKKKNFPLSHKDTATKASRVLCSTGLPVIPASTEREFGGLSALPLIGIEVYCLSFLLQYATELPESQGQQHFFTVLI